jgi:hypothetical protein
MATNKQLRAIHDLHTRFRETYKRVVYDYGLRGEPGFDEDGLARFINTHTLWCVAGMPEPIEDFLGDFASKPTMH